MNGFKFKMMCFVSSCRRQASNTSKNFPVVAALPNEKTPQGKTLNLRLLGYVCKVCVRKRRWHAELAKRKDLVFAALKPNNRAVPHAA